jgi:TPR repeat protein
MILLISCLPFVVQAESEWLVPQPEVLRQPGAASQSQQACDYQRQISLARQGRADSQYQVGLCYYYGLGVDADTDKALYWLKKASVQHHVKAMYQLGEIYHRHDQYHDSNVAMQWYRKAASADYAPAQLRIAEMYVEGKGVSQDYVEAYKWFYIAGMFSASGEPRLRGSVRRQRQALAQKMSPEQVSRAREAISLLLKRSANEH